MDKRRDRRLSADGNVGAWNILEAPRLAPAICLLEPFVRARNHVDEGCVGTSQGTTRSGTVFNSQDKHANDKQSSFCASTNSIIHMPIFSSTYFSTRRRLTIRAGFSHSPYTFWSAIQLSLWSMSSISNANKTFARMRRISANARLPHS